MKSNDPNVKVDGSWETFLKEPSVEVRDNKAKKIRPKDNTDKGELTPDGVGTWPYR